MMMMMYLFTTVPHPHGHWQLQELLGNHEDLIYFWDHWCTQVGDLQLLLEGVSVNDLRTIYHHTPGSIDALYRICLERSRAASHVRKASAECEKCREDSCKLDSRLRPYVGRPTVIEMYRSQLDKSSTDLKDASTKLKACECVSHVCLCSCSKSVKMRRLDKDVHSEGFMIDAESMKENGWCATMCKDTVLVTPQSNQAWDTIWLLNCKLFDVMRFVKMSKLWGCCPWFYVRPMSSVRAFKT